jgi:hypothetical protein
VPLRRPILAALLRQMDAMSRVFVRGDFSLNAWQGLHDELDELLANTPVDTLGDRYVEFQRALEYDQLGINIEIKRQREFDESTVGAGEYAKYMRGQLQAYLQQNVSTKVLRWVPLIRFLGDEDSAAHFEHLAETSMWLAQEQLSKRSPFQ